MTDLFDPHSVSASPSHLSPDRRGRGKAATYPLFLSPGQGERWFAQQTGVGVLSEGNRPEYAQCK